MNIYKKTLRSVTALFGALSVMFCLGLASVAHAATGLTEAIPAINEIDVSDNGTLALGTPDNDGTQNQLLTDFLTLAVTSNTKDGYIVTVTSSNGYLQHNGSGDSDAERISYTISCDAIADEGASVAGVNLTVVTVSDQAQTVIRHADPTKATNDNGGNCDFDFATGESMTESFSGTYSDTLTFAIAADV